MERNENPTSEDQPLAIKSLGGGNVDWGAAPIPGAAFAHWDRAKRREWQGERLELLLRQILPLNRFYATKWRDIERPWGFVSADPSEGWLQLPFTLKSELQSGPPVEARVAPTPAIVEEVSGVASPGSMRRGFGVSAGLPANLTYPLEQYVRFHQTSGTSGRPMMVLDTWQDWQWWMEAWQWVLAAAGIQSGDRAVLAFSFGPFVGFWSAFDALIRRGVMAIPAGGLSSIARLQLLRTTNADTLFCTPSYALHLAEVGRENQAVVADLGIEKIVVAGEPGGSIPAIRNSIETSWQARLVDHCGASEVGPWGFNSPDGEGLFVNEYHFLAEFRSLESEKPAREGELSELVLTTLGRAGAPVVRYRTGDLVRPYFRHDYDNTWVFLKGGVLGRVDDMLVIRGVNIFPSSIEQILRSFPEVAEFRVTAFKRGHLDSLKVEVEDRLGQPERIARELQVRLNLKVDVENVPLGSLPRFEMKGRRFVDQRHARPVEG